MTGRLFFSLHLSIIIALNAITSSQCSVTCYIHRTGLDYKKRHTYTTAEHDLAASLRGDISRECMPSARHGAGGRASVAAFAAIPDPTTGRLHAPIFLKGLIQMSDSKLLIDEVDEKLTYYREKVPELITLRAALLPFDDVIHTSMALPKGHSSCPDGDSHFLVGTYAPDRPETTVWFDVYADRIMTYSTSDSVLRGFPWLETASSRDATIR